jgi:hypothetical protein
MNRRAQLLAIWCGPAICVIFSIGALALARFIPPHISPGDSGQFAQHFFAHSSGRVRIGLMLMLIGMSLMPAWGMAVAVQLRHGEGRYPVLTWIQIASVGAGTALACAGCVCWAAGAFRPEELSPQFSRFAADLGWHFFLWAWPPFSVWAVAMGMAILGASEEEGEGSEAFPRWSAYVCFWTAFLFAPATGVTFFKSGPFGYNGLLALWLVMSVFFIWIAVTSVLTMRAIKAGRFHTPGRVPAPGPTLASPSSRPGDEPVVVLG